MPHMSEQQVVSLQSWNGLVIAKRRWRANAFSWGGDGSKQRQQRLRAPPPLVMVKEEVAALVVFVRRCCCAVGTAVRRAVDDK